MKRDKQQFLRRKKRINIFYKDFANTQLYLKMCILILVSTYKTVFNIYIYIFNLRFLHLELEYSNIASYMHTSRTLLQMMINFIFFPSHYKHLFKAATIWWLNLVYGNYLFVCSRWQSKKGMMHQFGVIYELIVYSFAHINTGQTVKGFS